MDGAYTNIIRKDFEHIEESVIYGLKAMGKRTISLIASDNIELNNVESSYLYRPAEPA